MKSKFYKLLSLVLSVSMVLSVCFVSGMISVSAEDKVTDYYVGYGGTGDGSSLENKAPNVATAIKTMNANGLVAGDTANIWIVQDIDKPALDSEKLNTIKYNYNYASPHNMAYWGATVEHEAKIVVKPYEGNHANNPTVTTTYLVTAEGVGMATALTLGGPTEIDGVTIVYPYGSNINLQTVFKANGNNVTFGSGVKYGYIGYNATNEENWTTGAITSAYLLGNSFATSGVTYTKPFKVVYNSNVTNAPGARIDIPAYAAGTYTFNEDVTFEFNGSNYLNSIRFGTTGTSTTTFAKNINFKFTTKGDQFRIFNGSSKVVVKGGLQIIADPRVDLSTSGGSLASWDALTALVDEEGNAAEQWYLNVANEKLQYIDFINGETGKFQLPADATAVATDAEGNTYTSDKNGVLDLSAAPGEYTVDVTVKCYDYYVKGGATGTGMSEDDPAPSIATAVTNMVNSGGLTAEDTANIWIMQDMTDITSSSGTHNMAYWGTLPEFSNTIHIKPHKDNTYTGNVTSTLLDMGSGTVNNQSSCEFTGDTIVEGVKFVRTSVSNITKVDSATLFFNGNNVTLGEGVTFGYLNANNASTYPSDYEDTTKAGKTYAAAGWPATLTSLLKANMHFYTTTGAAGVEYSEPIKVVYNNDFTGAAVGQRLEIPASVTGTYTFNDDVTVEFGGAASQSSLRLGTSVSTATITYGSDLNFKFSKASTGIRLMKGSSKMIVKGGVQVLAETGFAFASNGDVTSLDALGLLYKEDGTTAADMWYINVPASLDKIDFTSTAGVYKIADNCIATATNQTTGATKDSVDGVLDLTELGVGTYEVAITVFREKVYEYYVKAGGTGDGTDINNPAPNVATAIATINECRLAKGETATINIMQNIDNITGTTSKTHNMASWNGYVQHEATVVIQPYSSNTYSDTVTATLLAFSPSLAHETTLKFGGPTIVNDIKLVATSSTRINEQKINLNGESVTLGKGTTLAYLNMNGNSFDSFATDPGDITSYLKNYFVSVWNSYDEAKTVYTESVNLEFNQAYNTINEGAIFVGDSVSTFEEDVTVTLNLAGGYNPRIQLGTTYASVFNKNLNFKLTEAEKFGFNNKTAITVDGGIQFIYDNDTDKVSFHSNNPPSDLGKLAVKSDGSAADVWRILVSSDYIDGVDFVSGETGKFTAVADGLIAIATKTVADGEATPDPVVADENGVLDLSGAPGEYTISFVTDYSNDWSTIRIYKDIDLDLASERHLEIDGKLFIGWKYKNSDEYPTVTDGVVSLEAGDILVADYIDMAETDLQLEDIQLRADGNENDPAIRFIINQNKEFAETIGATEYGAIYLPADQAQGFEIFLDKEPVVSWYAYENENNGNEEWAVRETTGYTPIQITADPEKVLCETETDLKYTVCLTEIPESKYTTFYAVRGYMKFTDKNGIASATYTTQEVSSLYKEACDTEDTAEEDRTDVHNDIIAKAEALTAAAYDTLMASLKTPAENNTAVTVAGETLTDEEALATNNIIYQTNLYGTRYLRSITVDTGMNVEETDLLFVTDTHVTYSNEKDINTRYYNAMAYYKSRAYYGSSFNSRKAYAKSSINSANLASLFDKVVLGGDMADYVSDGNFQATKRIWSDRNVTNGNSLKGTISMTPGNHEFSQSSATAEEKLTNAELHDIHNGYMTSNSYIDYDIVYKADGKTPNYMTITLDNSLVTYYEEQIEPLEEYLAYARENNIPVILFQHVPNATGNEADADYWYTAPEHLRYAIGGRQPHDALYKKWQAWLEANPDATDSQKSKYADSLYEAGTNADGEAYPKGWQWTNMYNGTGHTGWNAYNEDAQGTATQIVYNLITSNYDIIKAVFCGHNHANYTTGIVATDADGNKLTDDNGEYITIPQYTVPAGYQNYATIINVK